jgi:CO/xanthine dehydrogenase Mo-binding subunit
MPSVRFRLNGTLTTTQVAIANATFDALGVRVRNLPLTRDNVMAAMEDN